MGPKFSGFLNVRVCPFARWRARRCQWEDWGPALLWWGLGLSERSWLPLLSRSSKLFLFIWLTCAYGQGDVRTPQCQKQKGNSWKICKKEVVKKSMGFAPGSTSQGHIKWSHPSAPRHNPSAGLTSSNPKYCHGKGSQASSRGCGFVHPVSPELFMIGLVTDCVWPFQGI